MTETYAQPGQVVMPQEEAAQVDFFGGVSNTSRWFFPGQSTQYIEFSVMNEGLRKKWQRKTSRDIKVDRKTNSAAIGVDIAGDREALLLEVCVDWYILNPKNGNQPVPFKNSGPGGEFAQWMNRQDPRMIDKLELAVREANPWMQDEMDSASIREEITRLEKLEQEAIIREQEKANF